jgi:hypothetical protein
LRRLPRAIQLRIQSALALPSVITMPLVTTPAVGWTYAVIDQNQRLESIAAT